MITLYSFGPSFGLPDPSPFVMKAMMLLKLAGLEHIENHKGFSRAPKGKLPFIDDDGTIVADSTFIRFHLEKTKGIDFDAGLSSEQRAQAWAIEKMCEEHLYWIMVHARWMNDANFERGPAHFFDRAPALIRPLVKATVRRNIAKTLRRQGLGRHSEQEIAELGVRDIEALATLLGDKPFLFGETPCGADATVCAFVAGVLAPVSDTPVRTAAEGKANLVAYRDRLMKSYFPQFSGT
ncbi:MAG: glutathione S-transferase family protein [Methylocystis sp.]|nr:glutathione S-transferase family protein [Methylocystis sp.]